MRHVRGWVLVASVALSVGILCGAVAKAAAPEVQKNGILCVREGSYGRARAASRALLLYHNGGVMTSGATIKAIFWGRAGRRAQATRSPASTRSTAGSATRHTCARTRSTRTARAGAHVYTDGDLQRPPTSTRSATPSKDPGTSGVLRPRWRRGIATHDPVPNGYYPVYTDIPRGTAGYCAWHSWGAVGTACRCSSLLLRPRQRPGLRPRRYGTATARGSRRSRTSAGTN